MNNKGFTLIEVLAVIVILSIIMGLALPAFTSSLEKNKRSMEMRNESRIKSAAELYIADYKFTRINNSAGSYYFISVNDLVADGYLSYSDFSGDGNSIGVIYNKDTHEYEYTEEYHGEYDDLLLR